MEGVTNDKQTTAERATLPWYQDGAGTSGASGCGYHDDLHACAESRGDGGPRSSCTYLTRLGPSQEEIQESASSICLACSWSLKLGTPCGVKASCRWPCPVRKDYRHRGRDILFSLKRAGRLPANQDWTGWLDQAIEESEAGTDPAG